VLVGCLLLGVCIEGVCAAVATVAKDQHSGRLLRSTGHAGNVVCLQRAYCSMLLWPVGGLLMCE